MITDSAFKSNKVSFSVVNSQPNKNVFATYGRNEKKDDIHNTLVLFSDAGVVRGAIDGDCENGFSYNSYNSLAAQNLDALVKKYYLFMYEEVVQNLWVVDDTGNNRTKLPFQTGQLKQFLFENPLPDIYHIIKDYVVYGRCGYWDLFSDRIKRIPMIDCDVYYENTADEYIRFKLLPMHNVVPYIAYHTPTTIGGFNWALNYGWVQLVNDRPVEFFKKQPYHIAQYDFSERMLTVSSIGLQLLSNSRKGSHVEGLLMYLIQQHLFPPIAVDLSTNPRSEKDLTSNNNSVDLTIGGVTYIENTRSGVTPFLPLRDVSTGSTPAELMSYKNLLDSISAYMLQAQAGIASVKSNITADSINQVNQQQSVTMDADRKKFIKSFLRDMMFVHVSKNKDLGIKRPSQLYFGVMDGNLSGEDMTRMAVMQEVASVVQLMGEAASQVIDIGKLKDLLKATSIFDIYQ